MGSPSSGQSRLARLAGQEGAKASLIAVISTAVFFGLLIYLVGRSPSWPAVQAQFFSWKHFKAAAPSIVRGFWFDMWLFGLTVLVIPIVSILIAVLRSFRGPAFFPIRLLATTYIDVFRGIPIILLILLLGFGLPALQIPGLPSSGTFWAIVALVLSYSAYTAEIYRSGIDSVPEAQRSSARAMGLSQWQTMRFAILPMAVRNVVPALMNVVVSLQKDVALVYVIGAREAVREAEIYKARTFNYTSFIVTTLLFLAVSIPLARAVDWYSERDRARRGNTGMT